MSDTVHRAHSAHSRTRSRDRRLATLTALAALTLALVPAIARADGDPASDVLLSQQVFIPWDDDASAVETARLQAVVGAANRAGYPTRVAVIASASDLGSVTQLWRKPQSYAEFLGVELSLVVRGSVVVVMPNGDGVYRPGLPAAAARAALATSRAGSARGSLIGLAAAVVERLAAADGHPLPSSAQKTSIGAPSRVPSGDVLVWIALVVGGALVVLAWAASLRARPLRVRTRPPTPSAAD